MRKYLAFILAAITLAAASAAFGSTGFGVTGDAFLAKLAGAFYRIRGGFDSSAVSRAEQTPDGLILSYNDAIFLSVNEKPGSREVRSVSVVLLTQEALPARPFLRGAIPADTTMFENICLQLVYALNSKTSDEAGREIMEKLGGDAMFLDGKQRSAFAGDYRYILKLHENGMAILVADKVE